jgi:hypothetical protein
MYVSLGFGTYEYNTTKRYRCVDLEQGVTVINELPHYVSDVVMYMFNGDLITDLGNLYEFGDIGSLDLTSAIRLRYLRVGNHANKNTYTNTRLTELSLLTCNALEYIDLTNCKGFGTQTGQNGIFTLNLANQTALREFYADGATMTNITFPETETLHTIHLGDKLRRLRLVNLPGLTDFRMSGGNNLESVVISNTPTANTYSIVYESWATGTGQLTEVNIDGLDWKNCNVDFIDYLANIGAKLKGTIQIAASEIVTFEMKKRWITLWGNIDNSDNELHIIHGYVNIAQVLVTGETDLSELGDYQMDIIASPLNGNNISKIEWELSSNNYATIDKNTGVITVHSTAAAGLQPNGTVTAKLTRVSGSIIEASMTVNFYKAKAKRGDYLFNDGSYSSYKNNNKTVIGIVTDVDETGYHGTACNLNLQLGYPLTEIEVSLNNVGIGLSYGNTWDGIVIDDKTVPVSEFITKYFDTYGNIITTSGAIAMDCYEYTDKYIEGAKKRVQAKGKTYPRTKEELLEYINLYPDAYGDCAPVALMADFYEPKINENHILADQFKAGNWKLIDARNIMYMLYLVAINHECYNNNTLLVPIDVNIFIVAPPSMYSYNFTRFWHVRNETNDKLIVIYHQGTGNVNQNDRKLATYYMVKF